ncbi:Pol polyprotein, partial [Trichinella nelsoni]
LRINTKLLRNILLTQVSSHNVNKLNDVGHLGVNSTRAELGRRFFIPKCISTVKHEIYKCKVCRTHRPIAMQVPTAPLHLNRLQYRGFPFVMCGMDFFGPFVISRKQKRWGLIFMCLTTRAIHLEDCVSTNVESFLLALERFIQRRGKPQSIRSDQGTSFVKAAKEQDKSVKALAEELECQVQDKWRIDFKFNPPGAPHWGGSWERMVQEIKKILMSTVESVAGLHQEAFRTLIVRVEGILNRRPITIDENGHSVCPMDIVSPGNKETQGFPTEASTLEVLRQVRQAAQRFWKRWYHFYLASLSADRNHGGKGQIDIRSGDTVLLKEGSNPLVDSYITAKVVEVFRSNDGYVRSAMLKTANGKEVVRDIRRISIMEGPALERMKMPVVPPASGGVSHPELAKSIELTTRSSEAHNGIALVNWKYGSVFRSNDGYVRSAMLKTANGKEVVRDIRRISIMEGPALERMKMPVVPPASGGVSHPELAKSIELTTRSSEAHNGTDELLATTETPSSAEIIQPPATKNNDPKTNSTRPILKLPTFDGDILQFKAFWDQFNAAVHRGDDLEDVTKFVHLRSCLAGAALHAISGVTTAVENSPAVVQLLHDRFYRVSDVLDAHILKIFSVAKEVAKGKEGLLALHDKLNGHLLELRAIGRDLDTTVSGFRTALPQLVAQLPKNIQSRWKDQCGKLTEEPTSQTFLDFLAEHARCAVDLVQSTQGERMSSPTHKHTVKENQRKRSRPPHQTIGAFHTSLHPICSVCQGEHRATVCPQFLNQLWSQRRATAARLNMCFICLTKGHRADRCKFKHRGWRTHHLLTSSAPKKQTPRPEGLDDTNTPPGKKARPESSEETSTRVLLANTRGSTRIRFQTVKAIGVEWEGANGKRLVINCLFDSGAEQTLVTEDTARALGLVGMPESVTVKGIGGIHCTPTLARRVSFRLSPVKANDHDLDVEPIEALTLSQICDDIQSVPVQCDNWKHLQHLRIPEEQEEKLPVHVLIGVDSYGRFLGEKILRGNPTEPVAIETTLGWVVFGPVNPPSAHQYRFHCAQMEDNMERGNVGTTLARLEGTTRDAAQNEDSQSMDPLPTYAACAYIRVESMDHQMSANLVISRNRVAPLRQISLPRLELMAALLCARLKEYLEKELTLPIIMTLPGDLLERQQGSSGLDQRSTRTLEAVRRKPSAGNPGINVSPVLEILEPADIPSRAVKVLTGQTDKCSLEQVINPSRYSRYETLIRVTAYCLRFARNCQSPASERTTDVNLSVKELWNAETIWLREIQVTEFGTKPNSSERVRVFEPFLDQDGLLRMGGRLRRSTLPPESKHPIILPNNHPVTELLIKDHHVRQMQPGVNQTLVTIRTKFWIIRARNAVKKIIRSCPVCRRVDAQPYRLRMGDLPADRVTETQPFIHTGVDFAGPLFIRPDVQGRNVRVNKAYVCIFTCMTTRAVHLELLREQTTDSFLQGLRRFISRRGRPRVIQSDNFRSDNNWEKLQRKINEERIRWKFITPRSPWCGGYWERLIRSIKNALRKTVRGALLKYDELHTVLCEIEARINDRPLVFMGDDIAGEAALTPAHFLIGRELSRLPSVSTGVYRRDDTPSGVNHLTKRWRYQQRLTAQLWKRWKQEYITTLATCGRWRKTGQEPKVGDIVLVHEPSTAWIKWPIGMIIEIHPSEDGVVRSATVKTIQGSVTRSARSLRLVEPSGDA